MSPSLAADGFKMLGSWEENSIPVTKGWECAVSKQLCKSKESGSDLLGFFR